jgi:SAM-dependent methyltransferase
MILYAITIFLSASLLFVVQPLFARLILPLLGGSPSVWNTALAFYQVTLLAGYSYAHLLSRRLSRRAQVIVHGLVVLLPLLVLPIHVPTGWTPPTSGSPVGWLLGTMAVAVGLPFFVVSANSPLLQGWFAGTKHQESSDPYFLYGASNLGSLLALVSYPIVIERVWRLGEQSQLWAWGYGILAALIIVCGVVLWQSRPSPEISPVPEENSPKAATTLPLRRRIYWLFLAFVPSSLMLGLTTYISTDLAAIPLLWVIPLSFYLFSFVIAFARRPLVPHSIIIKITPIVVVGLMALLAARPAQTNAPLIGIHLAAFFIIALACHGELARDRPGPEHLTEFYFWLSLGGALGGIFNALIAPLIFNDVFEYPLTLVVLGLVLPAVSAPPASRQQRRQERREKEKRRTEKSSWMQTVFSPRVLDALLPIGPLVWVAVLVSLLQFPDHPLDTLTLFIIFGPPALVSLFFIRRPVRFSLGLGAILLASLLYAGGKGNTIYTERTFFGVNRVVVYLGDHHVLFHGTTLHGAQSLEPAHRDDPLTYYYRSGPLGQVFAEFSGEKTKHSIAVVGLGGGSTACYHQPGQAWTFYEIDPAVVRLARNPKYFTLLDDCAPDARVVLGDARLELASAAPHEYDLMILDAYSSDAVPVHLITREALQLYLDKLAPDGVLAFHLTNRHLDLKTVVGNLALDAGLVCRVEDDLNLDPDEVSRAKMISQWAVMARTEADLGALAADPRWTPPPIRRGTSVWTDDFNNLLSVLR